MIYIYAYIYTYVYDIPITSYKDWMGPKFEFKLFFFLVEEEFTELEMRGSQKWMLFMVLSVLVEGDWDELKHRARRS